MVVSCSWRWRECFPRMPQTCFSTPRMRAAPVPPGECLRSVSVSAAKRPADPDARRVLPARPQAAGRLRDRQRMRRLRPALSHALQRDLHDLAVGGARRAGQFSLSRLPWHGGQRARSLPSAERSGRPPGRQGAAEEDEYSRAGSGKKTAQTPSAAGTACIRAAAWGGSTRP